MVNICDRLREERERMCLNQTDFASLGGCTQKTQVLYEKGERKPNTVYLSSIAAAGADINYIITGQRTQGINPHQQAVLQLYTALSNDQQREILRLIEEKKRLNELGGCPRMILQRPFTYADTIFFD